jgi:hypothetical protein
MHFLKEVYLILAEHVLGIFNELLYYEHQPTSLQVFQKSGPKNRWVF